MIPAYTPIELKQNDSWIARGVIYDDQQVPQVVNIQNATILVQVRRRAGGESVFTASIGDGVTVNPDNSWLINKIVDIPRPGSYVWEFQVTQTGTGQVDTYYGGPCSVFKDYAIPAI
jgi:fumarylacetoacetate (FAA) hydrolase family protein